MKQKYELKIAETHKKVLKIKVAGKTIGKLPLDATGICFIK